MSIKLKQPIIDGSLRATNFFNGRLVTGADMTREQNARREAVWRVGKATGDGVVYGLEVEKAPSSGGEPVVNVTEGLAVNRCGQTLYLAQETSVNLLQRFGTVEQPSKIFGDCQTLEVGTYAAGFGLYLLVLSPAETREGNAPTSGLNNAFATCNTDVILETAQFNLLPLDSFLKNDSMPDDKLLRNYIAYRCFGTAQTQGFFKDPLGFSLASYGLLDEMRGKSLSDSDVPLAIINWTSSGLQFVEMWAVRRRLTKTSDDEDWTSLTGDRRLSENEAMMRQFADQIESLLAEESNLATVEADKYFRYLPPAGILPIAIQGASFKGFNLNKFFESKASKEIAQLDGDRLRVMFSDSLRHEPIDLKADEKIQLYYVRENQDALKQNQNVQQALVFARHSLPYYGVARFGRANWDLSRFAPMIR